MDETFFIVLVTLIGSISGTVTSFGTATIMVPLLAGVYPIGMVIFFTGIIHWFGNIWKMLFFKKGFDKKLIIYFGIAGAVGGVIGALFLTSISEDNLRKIIGLFLIAYIIFVLLNRKFNIKRDAKNLIISGFISGVPSGLFGIGGAVRAAMLTSFNLNKESLIFTAGAIGLFIDSARILVYSGEGITLTKPLAEVLLVCILASFLGSYIGSRLIKKVSEKQFKIIIGIAIIIVSVKLIFG